MQTDMAEELAQHHFLTAMPIAGRWDCRQMLGATARVDPMVALRGE